MADISAVVATLNEEDQIEDCLKTISSVDEIIVVDSYSEDRTVEIAEEYADRIIQEESKGFMEAHRNSGIRKASNDYILRVDADERIPEKVMKKIKDKADEGVDMLYVPRKNFQAGRWITSCGGWPAYTPVLFRRGAVELSDVIHDCINPRDGVEPEYLEAREENAMLHYTNESFRDLFTTQARYCEVSVEQFEQPDGIVTPVLYEFFRRFIYMKGFRDGMEGLIMSLVNAQGRLMKQLIKYEKEGKWADE